MRRLRTRLGGDDRGLGLVELLVCSALLLVVLPLVGLVLRSAVSTQRDVRAVTDAGTSAQMVVSSVESAVRYAGAVHLDPWSSSHPDERLVVATRVGTASSFTPRCQAWFYDAAEETVSTKRVPADAAAPGALAEPTTPEAAATWTVVAEGVTRRPLDPATVDGPVRPVFTHATTSTSSTVTIDLRFPASPRKPGDAVTSRTAVVLSTSVTTRTPGEIARFPCV